MSAFVLVWSIVAVGQAAHVQADHRAAIGHHVDAVAVHGGRGADAQLAVVAVEVFLIWLSS